MYTFKNDAKNNLSEIEDRNRRRNNAINNFLNVYFKYIAVFIVFIVLWGGFRFFIKPRFDEALSLSGASAKQKKTEFINAYNKMEEYKRVLTQYSEVSQEKAEQIARMVPAEYSRDDLFTEITYFLIQNGYKINNINIINPSVPDFQLEQAVSTTSRRSSVQDDSNNETDPRMKYIKTLPPKIGVWFITIDLSNIKYEDLKKLLHLLESNLKLMDVFSVDFKPSPGTVNIGLLTYYHKD